jgi:hypothetical protein
MRKLLLFIGVGAGLLIPASAQAGWGAGGKCTNGRAAKPKHCYAEAQDDIATYAAIGYQDTVAGDHEYECGTEEGISNELWAIPESQTGGWIEIGQEMGDGYCDQQPHLFIAEEPPVHKGFKIEVSNSPSPENQWNMYAISDLPERNGKWHTYYRIPNESGVWAEGPQFGGGWSAKMRQEQSGMEVIQNQQPIYEGATLTAVTETNLEANRTNWVGYTAFAESGSTCILPLTGEFAAPGNVAVGACG